MNYNININNNNNFNITIISKDKINKCTYSAESLAHPHVINQN